MLMRLDLTFFEVFSYCACAGHLHFPGLSAPYGPIDLDADVNDVNPDSRTTYANDVKISNFAAGTAAILNIG